VKYSPNGGAVLISVACAGGDAVLAVRDHGVGIPAADLPHVFERFRRARNVTDVIEGTGIGLADVHQIVRQHGGSVQIDSQEGEGTTVTVRLPLAHQRSDDDTDTPDDAGPSRVEARGEDDE
jgi:signal transduction histidine kinase